MQASTAGTQIQDPVFAKYLKKLDKYGEQNEDECKSIIYIEL